MREKRVKECEHAGRIINVAIKTAWQGKKIKRDNTIQLENVVSNATIGSLDAMQHKCHSQCGTRCMQAKHKYLIMLTTLSRIQHCSNIMKRAYV